MMKAWQRWRVAAALLIAAALVVPRGFFGSGVLYYRDIFWFYIPQTERLLRMIAHGAWPLWDPGSNFGLPALANASHQVAYPTTWLRAFVAPALSSKIFVFLHVYWAGLGMYCLLRRSRMAVEASLLASIAWISCGIYLSFVSLFHHFPGLSWLPWVLFCLDRVLEEPKYQPAMMLGGACAAQVLGGSADLCLMTAMVCLLRIGAWFELRHSRRSVVRTMAAVVVAALFGAALSAVQWMTSLAYALRTTRAQMSYATITYWSLHPLALLDTLFPQITSTISINDTLRMAIDESREPLLPCLYLGMAAFALALLGAILERSRQRAFALVAMVLFTALAMGKHTVLHYYLSFFPGLWLIRFPVRFIAVVGLFFCVLLGQGAQAWCRSWGHREKRSARIVAMLMLSIGAASIAWAAVVSLDRIVSRVSINTIALVDKLSYAAAAAIAMAFLIEMRRRSSEPRRFLTMVVAFVAILDTNLIVKEMPGLAPKEVLGFRPGWIDRLDWSNGAPRVYVEAMLERNPKVRVPPGWKYEWAHSMGVQDIIASPIGSRWGLLGSYEGHPTGLAPPILSEMSDWLGRARGSDLARRLLRMGSVDYVVSHKETPWLGAPLFEKETIFDRPLRVYAVTDTLPKTYVAAGCRVRRPHQAIQDIADPAFDMRREVILEEGLSRVAPSAFIGRSRFLWKKPDALALEVESNAPAHVVVVEGYDPGWKATVDGARAPVVSANALFRAVPIPPGRHVVEMRYRPLAAMIGALTTLVAVLWGALSILGGWIGRYERGESDAMP